MAQETEQWVLANRAVGLLRELFGSEVDDANSLLLILGCLPSTFSVATWHSFNRSCIHHCSCNVQWGWCRAPFGQPVIDMHPLWCATAVYGVLGI